MTRKKMTNKLNNPKMIKKLYWFTRCYSQVLAAYIIFCIIQYTFWVPDIPMPMPHTHPEIYIPYFLASIALLFPYKVGIKTRFYYIRLTVYILISIAHAGLIYIIDHDLLGPVSIVVHLFALSSPISYLLFRKIYYPKTRE